MDKLELSERDICTKFVTPAIQSAGWKQSQFREEVQLTDGRVMVRGRLAARITNPEVKGGPKRADIVLYARAGLPIAVIEVKKAMYSAGHGMQQALAYAELLDAPFALSSNGNGFLLHDRTGLTGSIEREVTLESFPTLADLWPCYQQWKGLTEPAAVKLIEQPFYSDGSGREPRYYQRVAINRAIEAIANGQQRLLLVMATGTGKTYTAFQIIWRLWKAKAKRRILFLADRNILIDQTMQQDFAPFGEVMHKITNREVKKNYEIYLALYQAVTGREEWKQIYRQFPADFFDLIVVDECHRGSAADDSAWREVLDYFSSATHVGLTATPKESEEVSNISYVGEPIYTYSLKQGIEDGFLAPYKVICANGKIFDLLRNSF
jgi:type I restriction enzyme, R subunit